MAKSDALAPRPDTLPANVLGDRVVTRLREAEKALQQATTLAEALRRLPCEAGIYVLRHGLDVLYVGQSRNLRVRWGSHPLSQSFDVPGTSLTWFTCDRPQFVEGELIRQLRPTFNKQSWTVPYFWRRRMLSIPDPPDDQLTASLRACSEELGRIVAALR